MKNKLLIAINACLSLIILLLLFVYFTKNKTATIQGSYQAEDSVQLVQLVIDGDKYTKYVESRVVDTGEIYKSNGNAYLLDNGKQTLFLYQDGKDLFYFDQNIEDRVLNLKKFSDTPNYINQDGYESNSD
ncbi:hypothetical protein ACYSNW_03460 [Enterococcus sp. LJL99]